MAKEKGKFTIDAIIEQPSVWKSTIKLIEDNEKEIRSFFTNIDHVVFTGCGSNYYMSLASAVHFQHFTGIPSRGVPASEIFLYPVALFNGLTNVLVITLCRSGETTEVVKAIDFANNSAHCKTLYIGCYPKSTVAGMCSFNIAISEAQEESVVTTKSYTSMFLAVQMIAGIIGENKEYIQELKSLPDYGRKIIDNFHKGIKSLSYDNFNQFVFLGSGPFYGIACESMLKMKEMALVPSDAFHSLEFRHGPKSILSNNMLVIQFLSDTARQYEVHLIKEIRSLNGKIMVICEKSETAIKRNTDFLFEIDTKSNELARSILYLPITQLLAFYKASSKGIDVDTPKNLNHYVTL